MKLLVTNAFKNINLIEDYCKKNNHVLVLAKDNEKFDVYDVDYIICNQFFLFNDISMFKNLKYIQLTSSGKDRVDNNYVKNHGIKLFNAEDTYVEPITEWIIGALFYFTRGFNFFNRCKLNHEWIKNREIKELSEYKICILGTGYLGKNLAKALKSFNVSNLIGVNSSGASFENFKECINLEQFRESVNEYDVIISCLALNENTKHLFSDSIFKNMVDDAILINASRGEIIDENALIKHISRFRGVALDVFEKEPLAKESILWDFENVLISPHNSFVSGKNIIRLEQIVIDNLNNLDR